MDLRNANLGSKHVCRQRIANAFTDHLPICIQVAARPVGRLSPYSSRAIHLKTDHTSLYLVVSSTQIPVVLEHTGRPVHSHCVKNGCLCSLPCLVVQLWANRTCRLALTKYAVWLSHRISSRGMSQSLNSECIPKSHRLLIIQRSRPRLHHPHPPDSRQDRAYR